METLGQKGENCAAEWLEKQGYEIIARNWRTKTGEIDIIALYTQEKNREENRIVFVEVKTLPNTQIADLDIIISKKKQMKICKTAKHFLSTNRKYNELYMRFDVIVLTSNPFLSQMPNVLHLQDAFGDCYE